MILAHIFPVRILIFSLRLPAVAPDEFRQFDLGETGQSDHRPTLKRKLTELFAPVVTMARSGISSNRSTALTIHPLQT